MSMAAVKQKRNKSDHHKLTVNTIDFYKTYMVRKMRVTLGISAYEQSFLLGKNDFFVRDVENPLTTKRYNTDDTNYLLLIYDELLKTIMLSKIEQDAYTLQVTTYLDSTRSIVYMIKRRPKTNESINFHDAITVDESNSLVVAEEKKHVDLATVLRASTFDEVKSYIDSLLEGNFFSEPKRALDIFKKCKEKFGRNFHPRNMINVINYYTNKKSGNFKIDKNAVNEFGRRLFVKSTL
jgi:hypothetical protein